MTIKRRRVVLFMGIFLILALQAHAENPTPIFSESFESLDEITANGGTYSGITIVPGKSGNGVLISNSGAFLSFLNSHRINFQKGTIEFWVSPTSDWSVYDSVSKTLFDASIDSNNELKIYRDIHWTHANALTAFFKKDGQTQSWLPGPSTYSLEPYGTMQWKKGEWHRIRFYWDYTLPDTQKYEALAFDDQYVMPTINFNISFSGNPDKFYIGSNSSAKEQASAAVIDDFKIYGESLLPASLADPTSKRFPFDPKNIATVANYRNIFSNDGFCSNFETYNDDPSDCPKLSDSINPSQNVLFYQKPAFQAVYENTVPAAGEITSELKYQQAQKEYQDLFFNIYSRVDLNNVKVSFSDFQSSAGTIPKENFDLRVVKNWFQGGKGTNYDYFPAYVPELLLPNDQVTTLTSGWSNVPSLPVTGYAQTKISQNTSKQFALIAKVPAGTPAGTYSSTVTLTADGQPGQTVKITLEVLPFELKDTGKNYSIFGGGEATLVSPTNYLDYARKEFLDMQNHGFNGFLNYWATNVFFSQTVPILKELGFKTVAALVANDPDPTKFKQSITDVMTNNGFEPFFRGRDEVGDDAGLTIQINMSKLIRSIGGKVMTTIMKDAADRLDNLNDPIYSTFPTGTFEPLDWSILEMGTSTVNYMLNLMYGKTTKSSKPETYYWQDMLENPQINRYLAGYFLWLNKMDGASPHGYQSTNAGLYDDFNSTYSYNFVWRPAYTTYPSKEGPVPTIEWEALGAGITDAKYLATWQYYEDQVAKTNPTLVQQSQDVINGILNYYKPPLDVPLPWYDSKKYPMSQYESDRQTITAEILKLKAYLDLQVIIYGDVSGDGTISAYDAALCAQAAVGLITLTDDQKKKADVSGDGNVSAYDASLIAQKAVGLITKFPVEG